jgi:hypothetical protein
LSQFYLKGKNLSEILFLLKTVKVLITNFKQNLKVLNRVEVLRKVQLKKVGSWLKARVPIIFLRELGNKNNRKLFN